MPAPTPTRRPGALRAAAALLALGLLTAGCGGDDDEPEATASATPSPSPSAGGIDVPEGVELTEPGTELDFGGTATVAYLVGQDRGSVVRLTVTGARAGTIADLAAFQLDERTLASTPYYVQVDVANVGTEDIGGAAVPLFAVDGRDILVQPSTFTTSFEPCPSVPLPETFAPAAEASTCLVYLLPDQGTLEAMSYRPLQSEQPITWTGEVTPAEGEPAPEEQPGESPAG